MHNDAAQTIIAVTILRYISWFVILFMWYPVFGVSLIRDILSLISQSVN
jgi:hypothetical protein